MPEWCVPVLAGDCLEGDSAAAELRENAFGRERQPQDEHVRATSEIIATVPIASVSPMTDFPDGTVPTPATASPASAQRRPVSTSGGDCGRRLALKRYALRTVGRPWHDRLETRGIHRRRERRPKAIDAYNTLYLPE